MLIFIAIPLYYLWLGIVLPIHIVFLSLGIAIAFGFFGTRQVMKDEEERNFKMTVDDKILKIPCPVCHEGRLVELTSPREDFVLNSYKGLIYCTICEFEMSKDEFDKKYQRVKNGQ